MLVSVRIVLCAERVVEGVFLIGRHSHQWERGICFSARSHRLSWRSSSAWQMTYPPVICVLTSGSIMERLRRKLSARQKSVEPAFDETANILVHLNALTEEVLVIAKRSVRPSL